MSERSGTRPPERARLFVALDLASEARTALERWGHEAMRGASELRALPADALHVTLCFLGWRGVAEIDEIGAACAGAVGIGEPLPLSFGDAIWLPRRRPSVLAVELRDPTGELGRVQAAVSQALSDGGWYAPEARPYLGHVTVARVRKGRRIRALELAPVPSLRFAARSLTLYRSRLSAGGARYEALRRMELGEPCGDGPPRTVKDPVAVVRGFHVEQRRAYAGGDLEALRHWLSEDVVWHVPGRSRIAGEHRGIDAVLAYFGDRRAIAGETFAIAVRGLSLLGDRVVQLAGGSAVVDGSEVSWETVGVFRVHDGKIAECWLVPFDLYAFDEIWS